MRECPCCHFKDAPYWRNVRWRLYTKYCHIEDGLKIDMPELTSLLLTSPKTDILFKNYIYRYNPDSQIVQRIHVDDSRDGFSIREPEQEKKFWRFLPLGQSKLILDDEKNE